MKNRIVKTITFNAIVAAIYFCLTMISSPISFGPIQVRIAEALVLLCFFNRDYVFGVTIGCLLSNLSSPIPLDIVVGTLATFISCIGVSLFKHLFLSTLVPIVVNGFAIAAELFFLSDTTIPYFGIVGFIAIGEFIAVSVIGYLLFLALRKNSKFFEVINTKQNRDFIW